MDRKRWVVSFVPFIIFGFFATLMVAISIVSTPKYLHDKAACEAQGRFYWRGHCLPNECSVVGTGR